MDSRLARRPPLFNAGNAGKPATHGGHRLRHVREFVWRRIGWRPQLYSINIGTGQATVIGNTGLTSTTGGGLAVNSVGVFYGTPTTSRFGTYNPATGAYTNIANPTKPVRGGYGALDFGDGGILYGLDVGTNSPPLTHLVIIDPATRAVTDIGSSVSSLDAIAFQQPIPEPSTMALLGFGAMAVLFNARRRFICR